jgi:hypothetical protein
MDRRNLHGGAAAVAAAPFRAGLAGRTIHPAYRWDVKPPAQSRGAWDHDNLAATTQAEAAPRRLAAGGCPLVTRS